MRFSFSSHVRPKFTMQKPVMVVLFNEIMKWLSKNDAKLALNARFFHLCGMYYTILYERKRKSTRTSNYLKIDGEIRKRITLIASKLALIYTHMNTNLFSFAHLKRAFISRVKYEYSTCSNSFPMHFWQKIISIHLGKVCTLELKYANAYIATIHFSLTLFVLF